MYEDCPDGWTSPEMGRAKLMEANGIKDGYGAWQIRRKLGSKFYQHDQGLESKTEIIFQGIQFLLDARFLDSLHFPSITSLRGTVLGLFKVMDTVFIGGTSRQVTLIVWLNENDMLRVQNR